MKFKIWESALLAALCTALCISCWAQGKSETISQRVIRLHIIADDDTQAEQELKLCVRDEVMKVLTERLSGVRDRDAALAAIESALPDISAAAEAKAEGRSVRTELSRVSYPTRSCEGFTLPAGEYDSLRVTIGGGAGKNWWCVLYPVCSSDGEAVPAMAQEDYAIITESEGYEIRFRIVELWGELRARLKKY